jgi:hypothetical protein
MTDCEETKPSDPDRIDHMAESAAERAQLTYVGHDLPAWVILLWIAFFLFGLGYFVRHLA